MERSYGGRMSFKVQVYDHKTHGHIVLKETAKPFHHCECCGYDETKYMLKCDHLVLCRDCAQNWKRLGLEKFLETYWLPFDMPVILERCENEP